MANTEKTPTRRRVEIFETFEVEETHVSFLEDVIAHSRSVHDQDPDPNRVGIRVGRHRLRKEFDAIWHSR
jgi:hypothetical protein